MKKRRSTGTDEGGERQPEQPEKRPDPTWDPEDVWESALERAFTTMAEEQERAEKEEKSEDPEKP